MQAMAELAPAIQQGMPCLTQRSGYCSQTIQTGYNARSLQNYTAYGTQNLESAGISLAAPTVQHLQLGGTFPMEQRVLLPGSQARCMDMDVNQQLVLIPSHGLPGAAAGGVRKVGINVAISTHRITGVQNLLHRSSSAQVA